MQTHVLHLRALLNTCHTYTTPQSFSRNWCLHVAISDRTYIHTLHIIIIALYLYLQSLVSFLFHNVLTQSLKKIGVDE